MLCLLLRWIVVIMYQPGVKIKLILCFYRHEMVGVYGGFDRFFSMRIYEMKRVVEGE